MAIRFMIFIGWVLSAFSFVIALAGLATPSAGKLISLALIGWCLIFLPPLWRRTIKHGLPVNIGVRAVAFFTLPIIFAAIATANGYHSSPVADRSTVLPQKKPDKEPATASKQPVKEVTPKVIEKVTPESEPAKIVAAKPEQAAKAVEPKITQCEKDVKFASEVDRMHDTHSDVYPAFESCSSIGEFVEAVNKYPVATNNTNPKKYLAGICAEKEVLERGICADVPKMPGITTIYYLAIQGEDLAAPVGNKASMLKMLIAAHSRNDDLVGSLYLGQKVFKVKDEPVDVLARDGELVQVRLHATDINDNDLEGKVVWTLSKFLQTSYSYAN